MKECFPSGDVEDDKVRCSEGMECYHVSKACLDGDTNESKHWRRCPDSPIDRCVFKPKLRGKAVVLCMQELCEA